MFQHNDDTTPDEPIFPNEFSAHLFHIVGGAQEDAGELRQQSDELMDAFLAFGTETEDNLNAWRKIEYGAVSEHLAEETSVTYGLKVKGKDILLSTVANALEALKLADLPAEVREFLPDDLTDAEWDAATRMITMTLIGLERPAVTYDDVSDEDEILDDANNPT